MIEIKDSSMTLREVMEVIAALNATYPGCDAHMDGDRYAVVWEVD